MHFCVVPCSFFERQFSALLIQHTHDQSLEDLLDEAHRFLQSEKPFIELVLLRPPVVEQFSEQVLLDALNKNVPLESGSFLQAISKASDNLATAFARFPTVPIQVMFLNGLKVSVSRNINPTATVTPETPIAIADEDFLVDVRNGEFSYIVGQSRALLPAIPGFHYLTPSRRQVRSFVRVGNVQYSRLAIDAICFWLVPFAAHAGAILLDTWSISSIGFNLSRILTILDGRPLIPVEMFRNYLEPGAPSQVAAAEVIDRLAAELHSRPNPHSGRAICLASATHTGSLTRLLLELVDLSDFGLEFDFVALFKMGDTVDSRMKCLVDLSGEQAFVPMSMDGADKRTSIIIDPQVYFPLTFSDIEITVRADAACAIRDFIDRYKDADSFSVHRNHVTDGPMRHHAVHVDTRILIQSATFSERLNVLLKDLAPRPTAILAPPHAAAKDFVQLVTAYFAQTGVPIPHILHSNLVLASVGQTANRDAQLRDLLRCIRVNQSLLILDDAFITGARLVGYQTRLRGLEFAGKIQYLVGIARPDNLEYWDRIRKMLAWRHISRRTEYKTNDVIAVETLCLPNWQEDRCPWCVEKAFYDSLLAKMESLDASRKARVARLANSLDDGLRENIFLAVDQLPPLKLESDSLFAPMGTPEATVFSSIASAIQMRRIDRVQGGPGLGPRRFPVATIMKSDEYLVHTYTDSILRASFIRACSRDELEYTDSNTEANRVKQASALMASSNTFERNLSAELRLAAELGKIPI